MNVKQLQGQRIPWDLSELELHFPDWIDAIGNRASVRAFNAQPIPENVFQDLTEVAEKLSGISDVFRIDVHRGPSDEIFMNQFGKFLGTSGFAAFVMRQDSAEEGLRTMGFLGQLFVLHATSLGLSTCWVGTINSMLYVLKKVKTELGERVMIILPLGYPGKAMVMKGFQRTRRRTAWKNICPQFGTSELQEWQSAAFEAAKWAPSAHNKQPWSFSVWEGDVRVKRRTNVFTRWGETDCGIAMSHLHLIASVSGNLGYWEWGEYPIVGVLHPPVPPALSE